MASAPARIRGSLLPVASPRKRVRRRRRAAALLVAGALAGAVALQQFAGGADSSRTARTSADEEPLLLSVGVGPGRVATIDLSAARVGDRLDRRRLASVLASRIPARWVVSDGRARVVYRLDPGVALRAVVADDDGVVTLAARPLSSMIRAPLVAQALRNNCESAALEILLATVGVRVPQLQIQDALPTSGELDPVGEGATRVWGDPELGYVGRADGGGVAGGFGVYQGPVGATAARFGVALEDVSRRSPTEIVRRVRAGRAVMIWIGLSDGPYAEWRSPVGRRIRVNFGEHTVVLAGVTADGRLRVVNPLEGTREIWSLPEFEKRWRLLDRRALGVPL